MVPEEENVSSDYRTGPKTLQELCRLLCVVVCRLSSALVELQY